MRTERSFILLFLGVVIVAMAVVMFIPRAAVQAQGCDPAGVPCPGEKERKKTPTSIPPTITPIPTSTPIPTATEKALPIISSGAGANNPNSELPAIQNLGQGSSPFNLPGSLGMIIAVLIIVFGIMVGFFIAERRRKIGFNAGAGILPYMERGGNENKTIAVPGFGDFDGSLESGTLTVRDINDISPDAARSVREAASDPGGIQKPPSPNLGDKSVGGTL